MQSTEVLDKLDQAIAQLFANEINILERGLNELNLNGHLAKYLAPHFTNYHVDPEYNGDMAKVADRKELVMARSRMIEIGFDPNDENKYSLTPDIIVHQRNTNDHNLLILEIKKDSNSKRNKEFDLLKLEHMTINYDQNHYNYRIGAAIVFGTKGNAGQFEIKLFQNGVLVTKEELL